MSYKALLNTPEWDEKRLEILGRDKFTCQFCDATECELQVHHLWYEEGKKPWHYSDDCYLTLCRECHEDETEALKHQYKSLVKELRALGLTANDMVYLVKFMKQLNHRLTALELLELSSITGNDFLAIKQIINTVFWSNVKNKIRDGQEI